MPGKGPTTKQPVLRLTQRLPLEMCAFSCAGHGPRKGVQVYFTAVVGRAFFALQTTYAPDNGEDAPTELRISADIERSLDAVQLFTKSVIQSNLPLMLTCACCGETEIHMRPDKDRARASKVRPML